MIVKNRVGIGFSVTCYILGIMRLVQYMYYESFTFIQALCNDDIYLTLLLGAVFTYTIIKNSRKMYYIQLLALVFQSVLMLVSNSVDQFSIVVVVFTVRLAIKYGLYKDDFKLKMVFTVILIFIMALFISLINGIDIMNSVLTQKFIAFWIFAVIMFLLVELDISNVNVNKAIVYEDRTGKIIIEQQKLMREMQVTIAKTIAEVCELKLRLHKNG